MAESSSWCCRLVCSKKLWYLPIKLTYVFKPRITNADEFMLLLGSAYPFYINVEGEFCHSFIAHLFLSLISEYVPDALLEEGATPLLVEPITSEGDRAEEGVHK